MIYEFRDNIANKLRKLDPQKVGDELEALRVENNGELRKDAIVEAARLRTSPLHEAFTWDDEEAAHQYRLREAGHLVTSIVVVDDMTGEIAPAFLSVRMAKSAQGMAAIPNPYFQSLRIAQACPREFEAILKSSLMELESAAISLGQLKRLAPQEEYAKIGSAEKYVSAATETLMSVPRA